MPRRFDLIIVIISVLAVLTMHSPYVGAESSVSKQFDVVASLVDKVESVSAPKLEKPAWAKEHEEKVRQEQLRAQQTANAAVRATGGGRVFTYTVRTEGATRSSVAEFRSQAAATLSDARGWSRAGVGFQEASSGGVFNLILVEAAILDTIPGCSSAWSCRVGVNVYINDDRWAGATAAWNNAGGDLRNYRHMVINHEVGHWLGHDHQYCVAAGQPAPLMQQQSIDLMGCTFNPWPLTNELWVGR